MGKIGQAIATAAAMVSLASTAMPSADPPITHPLATHEPTVIEFDRSQQALFDDRSRVIAVNWHRQKGKDFTAACMAFDGALATGQSWFLVGMTQAQADETFAKVKTVAQIFKELFKAMGRPAESMLEQVEGATLEDEQFLDYDKSIDQLFPSTARILRFPNGARVVSLPGKNPDALAGRTGNLILTEFGLYPNGGYEHWDVLFPITQRGGYQLILISTPRGRNTKFYEVCSNEENLYSVHKCDIRQSVFDEGYKLFDSKGRPMPLNTDEEKEAGLKLAEKLYNSPAKWPREYMCEFTGDLSSLVTYAQLENASRLPNSTGFVFKRFDNQDAVTPDARTVLSTLAGSLRGQRLELGWDVARTAHLSVVWVNHAPQNQPKRLIGVIVMRNCSYEFMRAVVCCVMDISFMAVGAGDATGLGNESNETLRKKYGERWTPFMFSASGKRELASSIQTAFSDGTQTLPGPDINGPHKFIAMDIYAIQKDDTGENVTFDEGKNELMPESHCDIGWAAGLARRAGATAAKRPLKKPLKRKPPAWR